MLKVNEKLFIRLKVGFQKRCNKALREGKLKEIDLWVCQNIASAGWLVGDEFKPCMFGYQDIAKELGKSERTIQRSIARLVKMKIIDVTYRAGHAGKGVKETKTHSDKGKQLESWFKIRTKDCAIRMKK